MISEGSTELKNPNSYKQVLLDNKAGNSIFPKAFDLNQYFTDFVAPGGWALSMALTATGLDVNGPVFTPLNGVEPDTDTITCEAELKLNMPGVPVEE